MELLEETTRARAVREIARAFRQAGGNATQAAEALDVSHRTIMDWRKRYPALDDEVAAIREEHKIVRRRPRS